MDGTKKDSLKYQTSSDLQNIVFKPFKMQMLRLLSEGTTKPYLCIIKQYQIQGWNGGHLID